MEWVKNEIKFPHGSVKLDTCNDCCLLHFTQLNGHSSLKQWTHSSSIPVQINFECLV